MSTSERKSPRRFTKGELAKFGVTIVPNPTNDFQPILECGQCGERWLPGRRVGGRRSRLYWVCPQLGCNRRD